MSQPLTRPTSLTPAMAEPLPTPSDADLFASDFTYSFLKGVETTGPSRPRSIKIPRDVLAQMGNMERQFWEIKADHFDIVIFFKKGKFYELYDCDAVTANREFGLKMVCDSTNRGKMRMAGVPEQSFAEWARLFVFRGHKIGRVEQMTRDEEEEGSTKAKVVPRELVQILTSGTVTDPAMITGHQTHFVLALCPTVRNGVCVVNGFAVDLSRNVVFNCPCHQQSGAQPSVESTLSTVAALMHHLQPKEVILPSDAAAVHLGDAAGEECLSVLQALRRWMSSEHGSHVLEEVDDIKVQRQLKTVGTRPIDPAEACLLAYFRFLKLTSVDVTGSSTFTAHLVGASSEPQPSTADVCGDEENILLLERLTDSGVVMDAAAIDNLELTANLKDQSEQHSLYSFLNRCVTNGGRRLLRQWLLRPSSSAKVIRARQGAIQGIISSGLGDGWGALDVEGEKQQPTLVGSKRPRDDTNFRTLFGSLFGVDFERNMSRLAELKRENVKVAYVDPLVQYSKNLTLILSTISGFQEMARWAKEALKHVEGNLTPGTVPQLLRRLLQVMLSVDTAVAEILKLFDKKKAEKTQTIVPSKGAVPEYDAACNELDTLEQGFQAELTRLKEQVFHDDSISFCDIGKDLFLVEVSLASAKKAKIPTGSLVERTRTAKTIKYMVSSLEDQIEQHKKVTTAKSNALVGVLRTIAEHICKHCVVFHEAFVALSYVDCLMALASFAGQGITCTPTVVDDGNVTGAFIEGTAIYHPLLNSMSATAVPNDVTLSDATGRILVLTGPNMAGKSTMMRTVAVNMIIAQLGGFVFGSNFRFSPLRRVFTRIGARDAAHRGQSTLLVELSETSDILHFADSRSLCLIDELGRGTSTHDGYAIAHATLCHLGRKLSSTTQPHDGTDAPQQSATPLVIFSTHYHALALEIQNTAETHSMNAQLGYMDFALTDSVDGGNVKNIVFLFRLVQGICTRSYGVEVAVKAGINGALVETAQAKSTELSNTILERQMLQLLREFLDAKNSEAKHLMPEWAIRSASLIALGH